MPELPRISVIVPVRNGAGLIAGCLESLLSQSYSDFEIIVVDNNSSDKTAAIVSEYPVRLLNEPREGAYLARNTGIRHARGEIIAFTDADCRADRNWLQEILSCFVDPAIGGAGGNLLPLEPQNTVEEFLSFGRLRLYHSSSKSIISRPRNRFLAGALGSANMAFRSSLIKKLAHFNPGLKDFGADYDLSWQVMSFGRKLIYNPAAVVYHSMRSSLPAMIRQFYHFGIGMPLLLKHQPDRCSYLQFKTYLFPILEIRLKLPLRSLMTFDPIFLVPLLLIASIFEPGLLFTAAILALAGVLATLAASCRIVLRTGKMKWLLLYPCYHLIRIAAYTAGKIRGGISQRIISF